MSNKNFVKVPYDTLLYTYRVNKILQTFHEKRRDNISSKRPESKASLTRYILKKFDGDKWSNHLYEDEIVKEAKEEIHELGKRELDRIKRERPVGNFIERFLEVGE